MLRCESRLNGYAGFQMLFWYPYLAESKTAEGRDTLRALLNAHGYRNAHGTIDTSDSYIDNRLKARLTIEPSADLASYRRSYLEHLWGRATDYDGLANTLVRRSIDHTILLLHRLTTALYLDDAVRMSHARGFRSVDADVTSRAPTCDFQSRALAAGQILIWALSNTDPELAH